MRKGAAAVVAALMVLSVGSAYAQTQGMDRRDEKRDDREGARDAKQACKAGDENTRAECRQEKRDVKQVKMSVEGADVQITKAVLGWDNRPDDTITDIGVLKAGGSTTPKDAPGRKGRLKSVTVEYKIVGDAPTATLQVWGYD